MRRKVIAKSRVGENLCELRNLLAQLVHHVRGEGVLLVTIPAVHPPPLHRQALLADLTTSET